jgi:uncharacterized phiE125 gp8 family phage protein
MAFVTLALLKKHLRVSSNAEDELIENYYYPAALSWIADYTGREIEQVQRVYVTTLADGGETTLPAYPVQTINTVEQDAVGVTFTEVSKDINGVAVVSVEGHEPSKDVTITFTAGYADVELPAQLKQAILFLVAHFFHNRSEVDSNKMADVPEGAKRLCDPFRVRTFAAA